MKNGVDDFHDVKMLSDHLLYLTFYIIGKNKIYRERIEHITTMAGSDMIHEGPSALRLAVRKLEYIANNMKGDRNHG